MRRVYGDNRGKKWQVRENPQPQVRLWFTTRGGHWGPWVNTSGEIPREYWEDRTLELMFAGWFDE